jgi:glycosyltransferase involved in cell wall biosynthesis
VRILYLTQFFDPEPATIEGLPFASWLQRHGHEVNVVTGFPNYPGGRFYPGYEPSLWSREVMDGVTVNRVPLYPSHDRSPVRRTANYVTFAASAATVGSALTRHVDADAAYVYHPPATVGLPALLWKGVRRTPFVYHVQDMWPESVIESGMVGNERTQRAVERALSWWCGRVYRGASRVAVLSPGFKRMLIERGVPEEKIAVVANWAQEGIFKPEPPDPVLARELGMAGWFNVVYSGNLGHFQGLDCAIRAAAKLRHLERFRFVIVGSGQAEAELRALAARLAPENVRFLGRQPFGEMGHITALGNALLVSLEDRPFFAATIPSKTQVALACGRPVIMSVRGDAAALVSEADAGLVSMPGDVDDLAAAIEQLYNASPAELEAMGARGRRYYERELSLDRSARRLEGLLEAAAREQPRSR